MNFFEECKEKGFIPEKIILDGNSKLEKYNCLGLIFGNSEQDYTVGKTSDITRDYCKLHNIKLYVGASDNRLCMFAKQNNNETDFYCVEGIATTPESIYTLYCLECLINKGNDADFELYGLKPINE